MSPPDRTIFRKESVEPGESHKPHRLRPFPPPPAGAPGKTCPGPRGFSRGPMAPQPPLAGVWGKQKGFPGIATRDPRSADPRQSRRPRRPAPQMCRTRASPHHRAPLMYLGFWRVGPPTPGPKALGTPARPLGPGPGARGESPCGRPRGWLPPRLPFASPAAPVRPPGWRGGRPPGPFFPAFFLLPPLKPPLVGMSPGMDP